MRGTTCKRVRSVGPDGAAKAELRADVFRRMVGDDFTSLPRGDLAAAIYDTIDGKVDTIFGDSIAAIEEHGDGVHVSFEDGRASRFRSRHRR